MKGKRGLKKIAVGLLVAILITAFITGVLFYNSYIKEESSPAASTSASSASSVPSQPSRCSLVAQNDSYARPDFGRLKNVMQTQQIVKDVPEKGKISLRLFHFTDGCRIYDKSYMLSNGKIAESREEADIYIILHSNYVDKITETNFCDIVKESRNNGDLGQWSDVGEATLLWRYRGMLKYKECLGIKLTG